MTGWLIVAILLSPLLSYLVKEWISKRRLPYRYECEYCKAVGTTVKFASNEFGITRRFQLDHLDSMHEDT